MVWLTVPSTDPRWEALTTTPTIHDFDRLAFAARLKDAVRGSQRSERSVAAAAGISRSTLRSWCAGGTSPQLDLLVKVAALLGADLSWLLFGDHPRVDRRAERLQGEVARLGDSLDALASQARALVCEGNDPGSRGLSGAGGNAEAA